MGLVLFLPPDPMQFALPQPLLPTLESRSPETAPVRTDWRQAVFIAIACGSVALALYGWRIELSGDQNPQVVAAQSLLTESRLLVPPHPMSARETVHPPEDLRQTLFWFPPGYSLLLAGLTALTGSSVSASAAFVFWGNLLIGCWFWALWAQRVGFRRWQILLTLLFTSVLTRPSTTTDQLVTTIVGFLFLIDTYPCCRPLLRSAVISTLLCWAISMRWAATILVPVWVTFICLTASDRFRKTLVLAGIPALSGLTFYIVLSHAVAPSSNLYAGVGGVAQSHWILLWKAVWFADSGGWSPPWLVLRICHGLLVFGIVPGAVITLLLRKQAGRWLVLLGTLQGWSILFLIWVQYRYGMMYDPAVPAFATARFYSLAKPASVLLMGLASSIVAGWLIRKPLPSWEGWAPCMLYLALGATAWSMQNRAQLTQLRLCTDGFLRKAEFGEFKQRIDLWKPDCVVARSGYLFFLTLYDPRHYYPAGKTLVLDQPCRVGIVREREASRLSWEADQIAKGHLIGEATLPTFALAVYELAPGTYQTRIAK